MPGTSRKDVRGAFDMEVRVTLLEDDADKFERGITQVTASLAESTSTLTNAIAASTEQARIAVAASTNETRTAIAGLQRVLVGLLITIAASAVTFAATVAFVNH